MSDAPKALAVDLDQSLIKTDTLLEAFWSGLSKAPWSTLKAIPLAFTDRVALKQRLDDLGMPVVERLPLMEGVTALIQTARDEGREVVLASGATERVVTALSQRLGLEGAHLNTRPGLNMVGANKAKALTDQFGEKGFDYVGDSHQDIPVWQAAHRAYAVRPGANLTTTAKTKGVEIEPVGTRWRNRDLVRGLRGHQWIKNILLFLPIIAAQQVDLLSVLGVVLGIVAFSAAASAIYVVNDLLDLDADRLHETKCNRPFASGAVPIRIGMAASGLLAIFSLTLAAAIGPRMLLVISVYLVLTLAYSLILKRLRWVDVTTLGALYALRVYAGAVAGGVAFTGWLLAFVFPVFLTLACVKRLTELARAKHENRLPGRAYARADRSDMLNMSALGATAACLIFLGYSFSATANQLYDHLWILRAVTVSLALWLYRMISTGYTGGQSFDPILFALTDKISLILAFGSLAGIVAATGLI